MWQSGYMDVNHGQSSNKTKQAMHQYQDNVNLWQSQIAQEICQYQNNVNHNQ